MTESQQQCVLSHAIEYRIAILFCQARPVSLREYFLDLLQTYLAQYQISHYLIFYKNIECAQVTKTYPCCYRSRISEARKSFETTANAHNSENDGAVGRATTVRAIATVTQTRGDVLLL